MDGTVNTRLTRERKAAPHVSITAFIQPTTVVSVAPVGEMITVTLDGDDFGGVTLFFHNGEAFAAFVAKLSEGRREKPALSGLDVLATECELSVKTIASIKRLLGSDTTLRELTQFDDNGLSSLGFTRRSVKELRELIDSHLPAGAK